MQIDINAVQQRVGEWSDKLMGQRPGPEGPLLKLFDEVTELCNDPRALEEYADVYLVLMDAARISGYSAERVVLAAIDKHVINERRQWERLPNGNMQHKESK